MPVSFKLSGFLLLSVQFYAFLGDVPASNGESVMLVCSPDSTELSKAVMVPREKKNTIQS